MTIYSAMDTTNGADEEMGLYMTKELALDKLLGDRRSLASIEEHGSITKVTGTTFFHKPFQYAIIPVHVREQ